MDALALAWVSSLTYGLYSVLAKLLSKYTFRNNYQFGFFITLFGGGFIAIFSAINGAAMPTGWIYLLLSGLFLAIGNLAYIIAVNQLDVSVLSPLFNLRVAITVVLGVVILGESIDPNAIFFIGLILICSLLISLEGKFSYKSFLNLKTLFGLLLMLIISLQSIFINKAVTENGYWTTTFWISVFAILFLSPSILKFKYELRHLEYKSTLSVAALSVLGFIGDISVYKAYENNVGLTSVIVSLPISMIIVIILSTIRPKLLENHGKKVYTFRLILSAIMIWAALQLKN